MTRKITRAAAEIALGRRDRLSLGNLEVTRDWGAAADHVGAIRAMLRLEEPRDLVVASGVTHTLRELLETAFAAAGLGEATAYVDQDASLIRPADPDRLEPDPDALAETERVLGWRAATPFREVIAQMVRVDQLRLKTGVEESPDYLPATLAAVETGAPLDIRSRT